MPDDRIARADCCPFDPVGHTIVRTPLLCKLQQAIFEHAGRAIILTDTDGLIAYFNPAAERMLGYRADELVGRETPLCFHLPEEVLARSAADAVECRFLVPPGFAVFVEGLTPAQPLVESEWTYVRKDGSTLPVSLAISALYDGDEVLAYLGIASDISLQQRREAEQRIAAIAFESQAAIMVTDAEQRILRVNRAFSRLTGFSAEEILGNRPSMLKSGRQDAEFYSNMWSSLQTNDHWQGEIWNRRKNGEIFPEWLTISAVRDARGMLTHFVSTFSDISNLKVAQSEIHNLAFYDPLTALPNRRLLLDRLDKACATSRRSGAWGALLIIDIDNFKTLNDTLGHDVGDALLTDVSIRLSACIRDGDTAARQGGDEFVVMLENLGEDISEASIQAEIVAEKIRTELARPYLLVGAVEYIRTASIGVSLFSGQGKSVDVLLKQADIALYKAKDSGRNAIRFFDSAMQTALDKRAMLEAGLRQALVRGEFVLHAQPQVDARQRLVGAEVLLRWQPSGGALVSPADFIPLAEETGLIVPIGLWVLDQACAELCRWAKDPRTADLYMAVNVSARQFRQADFPAQVRAALARHGAQAARLKLELTESLLLENVDEVVQKMRTLQALGVTFSLDDFGTGYASLAYLKRYPFDQLKVDRSFIRDVTSNPDDAGIVRAILAMGSTLRLDVVAEGVEDPQQQAYLVSHGCSLFQGYLFGRPMPFADFRCLPQQMPELQVAEVDWVI